MRLSSLVEAHVRAILISKKVTREGEVIPYAQTELTVGTDSEGEEDKRSDSEDEFSTLSDR